MAMHNVLAVMYREYRIRLTSLTWMLFDLAVPMFYLFLFGVGFDRALPAGVEVHGAPVAYNAFFLAGVIGLTSFGIGMNTSYGLFNDRDNGIFYELLTYPMTRGEFLLGKIIFSAVITCAQALLTVAIGAVLLHVPVRFALLPLLLLANAVSTAGWFFALAIIALRITRNDIYNTVSNMLYFVLMLASSVFFPVENSPAWLRAIAVANPLTWSTDVLRYLTIGAGDTGVILLEAAGFVLFTMVVFVVGIRSLHAAE
jgi:ABC-type multidrug transport system permease subunit